MSTNKNDSIQQQNNSIDSGNCSSSSTASPGDERNQSEEQRKQSVAEIAARLREGEDFRLAHSLQEEEFRRHYSQNRDERVNMARDCKLSKAEQRAEQQKALEEHLARAAEIARRDEALAQELARQFEVEERRAQLDQAHMDAELAKQLQAEMADSGRQQDGDVDRELAERLQRQFIRQFREERAAAEHNRGDKL